MDIKSKLDFSKTVFLIDGSSFLYRAYYSLPPMHTKQGEPVQAVFGFCRMIRKLMNTFKPPFLSVVWDTHGEGPDIREKLYEAYKATRQAAPLDLWQQKKLIQEFLTLVHIHQTSLPGIEADDLMGSLTKDFTKQGFSIVLVTSDKDMGQLVGDSVYIFDPFKEEFFDKEFLEKRYGIPLQKMAFYYALVGDTVDNIPGVKGIGAKTAQELVNHFDSLEDLYKNIDNVSRPRIRELLLQSQELAFISQQLFTLRYYDLGLNPFMMTIQPELWFKARDFFRRLNFNSLLKEFPPQTLEDQKKIIQGLNAEFIIISTEDQLQQVCEEIKKAGHVAVDTETNSLNSFEADCVGISLCTKQGRAYYIPMKHEQGEQLAPHVVRDALQPLLEDESITKYFHNAKFDMRVLHRFGCRVKGLVFDTLIAVHLVSKDWQQLSLKSVSEFYLNQPMLTYDAVVVQQGYSSFAAVPLDRAVDYAAADAHQTLSLVPLLKKELEAQQQERLFYDIELPLLHLLFDMECAGVELDTEQVVVLSHHVDNELRQTEHEIKALLPEGWESLNLNSPKQLESLLFDVLKLPPIKKTAQKTGYSTDHSVLVELAKIHPIPALIVRYRELFKLKSTYLDALPTYVNPATGKIHTTFSQISTATGRLASTDPNLQNIPTGISARSLPVRSIFKAPQGMYYLSADYSQIELRVLAYLSQDPVLIDLFLQGHDIHQRTAAGLFDIPVEHVTPEQRALAKKINFSILYGLSPYGLSKDMDISYKEAELYIEKYFAQYPGVVKWMETVIQEVTQHGYVTTHWGRRRYVPGIYEKNKSLYDLARRIAINTKVQGTQAELMKLGMLELKKALHQKKIPARLILQIHDEVILTVPYEYAEQAESFVREVLNKVVSWNVPLVVTTRMGKNWQEITK